ncbi:KTSC domain-containing protein [Arthrospiribacter ruber]|uniref:KTSC domain-containing protein n=1 Tax=Arthrospiribacter ruber TaxID=2487934 RepID=A0A951MAX8_9BACT|nr:KTSC domain-containing protein [Arthrospiribacter ruber]MBW3466869.1 KTSC domain-containing protein [Arthrospiribacter ruber]
MNRQAVTSSNIASIGYEADSQTLEIEFLNGGVYQYFDVPQYVHEELMNASSHGQYLAQNIKGVYRFSKV